MFQRTDVTRPNINQQEAYYSNRIGMNWAALTVFLCVQRGHYLLQGGMAPFA